MDTQKLIVVILGGVGLLAAVGGITLTVLDKAVPDSIIALGSAGIGALASYLVQPKGE